MREVLNYLHKFWKETFTYLKDGRCPISNNLAESAIRPFITKRKNSLHFGNNEGNPIATVHHSIISTVKLKAGLHGIILIVFYIFQQLRFFESDTTIFT